MPLTAITWGFGEIAIVLLIFLLLFGSTKLPKLARSLGESMTEFKKGLRGEPDSPEKKLDEGTGKEEDAAKKAD